MLSTSFRQAVLHRFILPGLWWEDRMEVYAGIDWSREFHVLCVLDANGSKLVEESFDHTRSGLEALVAKLKEVQGDGRLRVAIELKRGTVVELLHREGITVVPVHPNHMDSARGCFGAAGNKNDWKDAQILAEVVRTSAHRLGELALDSEETRRLKCLDDYRQEVLNDRLRARQRLEATLCEVFPAAIGLFNDLDSLISLAFLKAYPTAQAAEQLTVAKAKAFFRRQRYSGCMSPEELITKIKAGAPGIAVTSANGFVIRAKAEQVGQLGEKLREVEKEIESVVSTHSLHATYASLPGTATTTVASLIGNLADLAAYTSPEALQTAAGLVPVVRQSGKSSWTLFRHACKKDLRRVLTSFADLSRRRDPWAAKIYDDARARNKKHQHALRILARAWTLVIFRMVKDRATYDPTRRRRNAA
jgi:transposase